MSFSSQGQIDWTAIVRSGGSFSVDVAARIMHGGVDACTIFVGRSACSAFTFPAAGQAVLSQSLSQLQGLPSYRKVLWFGFGLKNVVTLLCETDTGALLASISAALGMMYGAFDAALVWHQDCLLEKVPLEYRPSVHQWKCLVDACSGVLQKSAFRHHFDHFSRLLAPDAIVSCSPARPHQLAKALSTLADLSQGRLTSAIFVGGSECAWLAAIAKCFLCLSLEIHDSHGNCILRSSQNSMQPVQAFFKPNNTGLSANLASLDLVHRSCFIASGTSLLHERVDFHTSVVRQRSSWEKIFSDTFTNWSSLLKPPVVQHFEQLMPAVALLSEQYFATPFSEVLDQTCLPWWTYWIRKENIIFHPRRIGNELLHFAYQSFPELPRSTQQIVSACPVTLTCRVNELLETIAHHCTCTICLRRDGRRISNNSSLHGDCLPRMAITVLRIILMLSPVSIRDDVPPAPHAIRQIYNLCVETDNSFHPDAPTNRIELILFLFTAQVVSSSNLDVAGASVGGICAFYTLLRDPQANVLDAIQIEIIPGQIRHRDRPHRIVADMSSLPDMISMDRRAMSEHIRGILQDRSSISVELIIEESRMEGTLLVAYRTDPHFHVTVGLYVAALQSVLETRMSFHDCRAKGCSNELSLMDMKAQWTMRSKSVAGKSSDSIGIQNFAKWHVVHWDVWRLPDDSAKKSSMHIDIDHFQASDDLILLLLSANYDDYLRKPVEDGFRSGTVVVQPIQSTDCIVQLVLSRVLREAEIPALTDIELSIGSSASPIDPDKRMQFQVTLNHIRKRSRTSLGSLMSFNFLQQKS